MTAAAISAAVSGPDAVRKASCVSRDNSLRAKYRVRRYGRLAGIPLRRHDRRPGARKRIQDDVATPRTVAHRIGNKRDGLDSRM
jgi:hypothetical protein